MLSIKFCTNTNWDVNECSVVWHVDIMIMLLVTRTLSQGSYFFLLHLWCMYIIDGWLMYSLKYSVFLRVYGCYGSWFYPISIINNILKIGHELCSSAMYDLLRSQISDTLFLSGAVINYVKPLSIDYNYFGPAYSRVYHS